MIQCRTCGDDLVDDVEITTLTLHGQKRRFRRSSDYVACDNCGETRTVRSLRAELVARGRIDADGVITGTASDELQDAVEEALNAVRAASRSDELEDEDVDAIFTLLSDIAERRSGEDPAT